MAVTEPNPKIIAKSDSAKMQIKDTPSVFCRRACRITGICTGERAKAQSHRAKHKAESCSYGAFTDKPVDSLCRLRGKQKQIKFAHTDILAN